MARRNYTTAHKSVHDFNKAIALLELAKGKLMDLRVDAFQAQYVGEIGGLLQRALEIVVDLKQRRFRI